MQPCPQLPRRRTTIYALELDDTERVGGYLRQTLAAASRMMTDLLEEQYDEHDDRALVRSAPASLDAGQETGRDKGPATGG